MKKKFYLWLMVIVITSTLKAQQPTISVIWKDSINSALPFYKERPITTLPDSSFAFVTVKYNWSTYDFEYSLVKKNMNGVTVKEQPLGPDFNINITPFMSGGGRVPSISLFLRNTPDGNFVMLLNPVPSSINTILKFTPDLNIIWKRSVQRPAISVEPPGTTYYPTDPITDLVVNTDNSLFIIHDLWVSYPGTGGPRPGQTGSFGPYKTIIQKLNSTGIPEFNKIKVPFTTVKSSAQNGYVSIEPLKIGDYPNWVDYKKIALNNFTDTGTTKAIYALNNSSGAIRSNFAFSPNRGNGGQYAALYLKITGEHILHVLDTSLNILNAVSYGRPNIYTYYSTNVQFEEDKSGGFYFYNSYFEFGNNPVNYLNLGRLDSLNRVLFSLNLPLPSSSDDVKKLIPLDGNDFLLFISPRIDDPKNPSLNVYRIRIDYANPAVNLRNSIQPAELKSFVLSSSAERKAEQLTQEAKQFSIKLLNNPSSNYFTLTITSDNDKKTALIVTDASGRTVEKRDGLPANGIIQLGSNYKTGVYFVQVLQGNKSKTLKLLKQ
jgi:Secretion system C-terminal sorting domain